jgi:hypothetical protein
MKRPEPAQLAILLRHELLTKRGQLDETVEVWQVKIWSERRTGATVGIPLENELNRLVEPRDSGRGEQIGESLL